MSPPARPACPCSPAATGLKTTETGKLKGFGTSHGGAFISYHFYQFTKAEM